MINDKKPNRGLLEIDAEECKGCGLCVEACPPKVIRVGDRLNHCGYRSATYLGAGCTGCGICYMACPEPGAIKVSRVAGRRERMLPGVATGAMQCASN